MKHIVPTLALLAAGSSLPAVELSTALADRGADQYLQGTVLFEWLTQDNYTGDDEARDQFWLRAELGSKIKLEDNLELNIVFAYDAEFGDDTDGGNPGENDGEVVLDQGSILFKQFLRKEIDVEFGRQPVSWNLRSGFGAFLYDSRANNPDVTSWDGIVAHWDFDNVILRPFLYNLDENNESQGIAPATGNDRRDNILYGVVFDYEPSHESDNNIFVSLNATVEKNVPLSAGTTGDSLITYYVGTEWNFANGWDLYGEFAKQEGELDSSADFDGEAFSLGFNYYFDAAGGGGVDNALFGVQYDVHSGDDGSSDFTGFVAPHEGVSDLLIFEHERYGELSEQLIGNTEAIKVRFEWKLGANEGTVLTFLAGGLELNEAPSGVDDKLGKEYNLSIDWEYSDYTRIKFFGGYFDPDQGYEDLFGNSGKISIFGASIEALF